MSRFKEKVLQAVRTIPKGYVASYGQIALMVGVPRGAIQVGWVLHEAGEDGITPWWRVINNAGRISTNCVEHTANLQKELLEKEGVIISSKLTLDIKKYRFIPDSKTLKYLGLDDKYVGMLLDKFL